MSTRGAFGFIKDGQHKVTYNHFDSYPDALGQEMVNYIKTRERNLDHMIQDFEDIKLVSDKDTPTEEDIERCRKLGIIDISVSERNEKDWYCLLNGAQGELDLISRAKLMFDNQKFLHDSLFCEYAYIINLDTSKLEFYIGFQKSTPKGRYTEVPSDRDNGYYAVGLIGEFPIETVTQEDFDEAKRQYHRDKGDYAVYYDD